jgi:hypothetical protein
MKSEQYVKDWLHSLEQVDFDSGLDNIQIQQILTEIEVLKHILKEEE